MTRVLIIAGNSQYSRMYEQRGWEVAPADTPVSEVDLVQFTGGEDVSPWLYAEPPHGRTYFNWERDREEAVAFGLARHHGIPMAGICRGGQFLNVMCGGKLWQHVDGHTQRHVIHDTGADEYFEATSTHHQMMRPGLTAVTVGVAAPRRSTYRQDGFMTNDGRIDGNALYPPDYEILFYPYDKVFCFQPHPEFPGEDELADRYFLYLRNFLGVHA